MTDLLIEKKLRIMVIPSHLSTGGMPAFLLKRIEALLTYTEFEIFVVEFNCVSLDYVVQRDKIKNIVPYFYILGENKNELLDLIKKNNIDILQFDDPIEYIPNMSFKLSCQLYSNDRTWRICETIHTTSFKLEHKRFFADAYPLVSPFHLDILKTLPGIRGVIRYPIDKKEFTVSEKCAAKKLLDFPIDKQLFINIGLWNKNKNQEEFIEIARRYPDKEFAAIGNLAENFSSYWEPLIKDIPSNFHIMGEREDVSTFLCAADGMVFTSLYECMPLCLFEAIEVHLPILAHNLKEYEGVFDQYIQSIDTDLNNLTYSYSVPTDNTIEDFGKNYKALYEYIVKKDIITNDPISKININQHFVDGPFLEIKGGSDSLFTVRFYDEEDVCHYEHTITSNCWVKLNRKYYTKWTTKVWQDGILIYENILNYTGKRVYIAFDSESLGDSIAWIHYVLEFQKKHNCHVIVSTFKNFLFDYPELEFVKPGTVVNNIYGMYKIGWFYNSDMEPTSPNTIPLQQTATNILGLDYKEIIPKMKFTPKKRQFKYKYVTIATNSTMACKFFPKETWQEIINYLVSKGYKVINVSKEKNSFKNCSQIKDVSIENTIQVIHYSEFVLTLSSGLGWLAFGMNKQTVLLSNFTEDWHEWSTKCIRITNKEVCHGCWNKKDIIFSKNDWEWCPYNKGTINQFICHSAISSGTIIERIQSLII